MTIQTTERILRACEREETGEHEPEAAIGRSLGDRVATQNLVRAEILVAHRWQIPPAAQAPKMHKSRMIAIDAPATDPHRFISSFIRNRTSSLVLKVKSQPKVSK